MAKRKFAKVRTYLLSSSILAGLFLITLLGIKLQQESDLINTQAADPKLVVNGTTVTKATGERLIFEGVNLEYFRDIGCDYVTEQAVSQKQQIVNKFKEIGVNAVRLNYKSSWLSQDNNLAEFMAMAQLLANNGIYVMPSDHSFTGKNLTGFETTSFPLFKKIVEGARAGGFEDYLIMNPYNEPYGADSTSTWPNWLASNKSTLDYLRRDLSFQGIVVLDTKGWASSFDIPSLNEMVAYDSTLTGSRKVVFSNHWYPNHDYTSRVKPTIDASNQVPLLIGELGRINPGTTGVVDSYPRDLVRNVISSGIPKGHNGVFPWMWAWCDANNMTAAWNDLVNLSGYGQMYVDEYYNKVAGGSAPIPTPTPAVTAVPTPTSSATATPIPTSAGCKQICNFEDPNRCPAGTEWAGWVKWPNTTYTNDIVTVCTTTSPTVAPTPKPTVAPTAAPTSTPGQSSGDGLIGNYYNNTNFTSLGHSRVDRTINFNWNYGSPVSGKIDADTFSVVWSGFFSVPQSGDYTFSVQSDDGVRLYIDNKLVINNWRDQAFTEKWFRITGLSAGKKYPIKVEYYENRGGAAMKLFWQGSGPKEIVPQKFLYSK